MTISRFLLCCATALVPAYFMAGCGDSTDTRVLDSRTGQLVQALNISFRPDHPSTSPTPESETSTIGPATIAALTSQVDLFELNVETSEPVTKIVMNANVGGTTIEVGRSESSTPTRQHVIRASNSGFLLSFQNDGESSEVWFYVDTRGLAGSSLTFSITGARVDIASSGQTQLSAQNRSKTVVIEEGAKVNLVQSTTNTSFSSVGTNDIWQNFAVTNDSQRYGMTLFEFYVYASANNLTMTLNDQNGNLIGTFTNNGNGSYYLNVPVSTNNALLINAGVTQVYQIRGNPNGNKSFQITSFQINARASTGLNGNDIIYPNRNVSYP